MPLTVIVRVDESDSEPPSITFDGSRVVIGRGAGCDVRLPDLTVSHRHASIRADAGIYSIIDERSTNGTFAGDMRLAPHAPHVLHSGDLIRIGGIWLEVRMDQRPPTLDLSLATRDLALSLLARKMRAKGADVTTKVLVVEGRSAGLALPLHEDGRAYFVGSAGDLALDEEDAAPQHMQVVRRGAIVQVRDLGAPAGVFLADSPLYARSDVTWKPSALACIGRTLLALREPVAEALAELEAAPDETLAPGDVPRPPGEKPKEVAPAPEPEKPVEKVAPPPPSPKKAPISPTYVVSVIVALTVIAASVAGLAWLLRG